MDLNFTSNARTYFHESNSEQGSDILGYPFRMSFWLKGSTGRDLWFSHRKGDIFSSTWTFCLDNWWKEVMQGSYWFIRQVIDYSSLHFMASRACLQFWIFPRWLSELLPTYKVESAKSRRFSFCPLCGHKSRLYIAEASARIQREWVWLPMVCKNSFH